MRSYNKDNLQQSVLLVYVKYSDYTCSCAMGLCEKPEDVFEWLRNPESLQMCLDKVDGLIDNID